MDQRPRVWSSGPVPSSLELPEKGSSVEEPLFGCEPLGRSHQSLSFRETFSSLIQPSFLNFLFLVPLIAQVSCFSLEVPFGALSPQTDALLLETSGLPSLLLRIICFSESAPQIVLLVPVLL